MTQPLKNQFQNIEANSFEFYRSRANQERQNAMKDFFSAIFATRK